ncbi:L-arabinose isomerase [Paenibacillus baekrokdamisoli]|uniref:L-arabinose isomerase n=1 Tax=Paenibacillus baekrokdamisoli TaxID=1712516 RepID=A0A3G9IYY5_9BACL|nr:hypothetical protein [Paenibacillus baekrokdamisoli]MBB3070371.1 L-arabinose isomerase [Paenibacillus baekrokdamisoli]BBH21375.1 L-arabinose isomerase [Paenibacillus baekrokdamisoli]
MKKLKIGLLPLYIKLYDDFLPSLREKIDSFQHTIIGELEKNNVEVFSAEVCRIKTEFKEAIHFFEKQEVDAIVTLHLAYSPSLESASILAETKLPLVILDTTPTFDYSPNQNPDELFYNHGIHGVQDMCNLLLRNGKDFSIEAGHWSESDVLVRIVDCVKAARMAGNMKKARVGRVGKVFEGMGDFDVPLDLMRSTIGIETVLMDLDEGRKFYEEVTNKQIDEEIEADSNKFSAADSFDVAVYRQSTRACLAVREWIKQKELSAFTINFMEITKQSGIPTMPFLEASKAMARGIGYAGEGDVLTAALVGALLSVYPETSFTEMFCPDWKNNSIFLSHMGEMNLGLAANKPTLKEMDFPFTDADNPVVAYGRFCSGNAVYVNLAPGRDNTYSLILSPIEMLPVEGEDRMEGSIHGWFKPSLPISDFLSTYSKHGGTHHGVIVYGDTMKVMENFGEMMGWKVVRIG